MNPIEQALAKADKIIAANAELERVSAGRPKTVIDNRGNEHVLPGPFGSIAGIIDANRKAGYCWFSESSLAFFSSEIVYEVFGGRLFISSERGPQGGRFFTIRCADDSGDISTIGSFTEYGSKRDAVAAVKALVGLA